MDGFAAPSRAGEFISLSIVISSRLSASPKMKEESAPIGSRVAQSLTLFIRALRDFLVYIVGMRSIVHVVLIGGALGRESKHIGIRLHASMGIGGGDGFEILVVLARRKREEILELFQSLGLGHLRSLDNCSWRLRCGEGRYPNCRLI